jgi:tRNA_anti-like
MISRPVRFAVAAALLLGWPSVRAQNLVTAEAEASKCEDRIASVKRDLLGKYEDALADLQAQFQKAADLDGALAIRGERERLKKEQVLSEGQFVQEPKALRAIQQQHVAKLRELIAGLVNESVPRLVELKKALTVAGKLDEAITVRAAIERLQNENVPISKPEAGSVVPAETLLTAYAADRARADKTYKGQRLIVRGIVGGFRPDATENRPYLIYLTRPGTGNGGWVQCTFNGDIRCREEKQFNTATLVIVGKEGEILARLQAGQTIDIRGICEGFEETVRFVKCELPR